MRVVMCRGAMVVLGAVAWPLAKTVKGLFVALSWLHYWQDKAEIEWLLAVAAKKLRQAGRGR